MEQPTVTDLAPRPDDEQRIVEIVRDLAVEVGGMRVAAVVSPTASLERDLGLGSLERVELLVRIEAGLGRELADGFLTLDTPREIAAALAGGAIPGSGEGGSTAAQLAPAISVADAPTLDEALRLRARAEPRRPHAYLDPAGENRVVTYGALREGATRICRGLIARGVRRGDRVAIMLPTGLDFLHAFAGTLAAGAVAVPLYPPARLDRIAEYLQRQATILSNAGARLLIAMPEAEPVARLLRESVPELTEIVSADELRAAGGSAGATRDDGQTARISDEPALIQYTSGSTGDPRGVVLTHGNILANIRAIGAGVDVRPTDVIVSWLPLYHDMGLIGAWLSAMVWGIPIALMSPLEFLQRPERWLQAIDRHRGTLTASPNFAFELCVRRVGDDALAGLDLSTWRCALNGAEPVSASTIDRFVARFERCGFRRESLMPVYGLAEASVALCFPPRGRAPLVDRVEREPFERDGVATPAGASAPALTFVSVGRPLPGHEVRIVDESGREKGDRVVGRVVFRGPSCMREYHRNPEATARAMLTGGWIDSGDLGYRSGAELYITGRLKDVIIRAGRNLVPQEIEDIAASIDGVRKGCVVAFGVGDERSGTERLVVVAESRATDPSRRLQLERAVRTRIVDAVGVPPDAVLLVEPGTVPKTPSGKVQRSATRTLYLTGALASGPRRSLTLRARLLVQSLPRMVRLSGSALRRGVYAVYLAAASLVATVLFGPPIALLLAALPAGRPVRALTRIVARLTLLIAGSRLSVDRRGSLPKGGPLVIVANHSSYADAPVLLAALPLDFVFVAMREILQWRVIGAIVRRGGHPTVDRWNVHRSVADAAAIEERLRGGGIVLFFPEGRLGSGDELGPLRLGAFESAISTRAPVVPVTLRGANRALPHGAWLPRPGRIDVVIGEPIDADGEGWRAVVSLRDRVAAALAAHTT